MCNFLQCLPHNKICFLSLSIILVLKVNHWVLLWSINLQSFDVWFLHHDNFFNLFNLFINSIFTCIDDITAIEIFCTCISLLMTIVPVMIFISRITIILSWLGLIYILSLITRTPIFCFPLGISLGNWLSL